MRPAETYRGARRNELRALDNIRHWPARRGIKPGVRHRKPHNAAKLKPVSFHVPPVIPPLLEWLMTRKAT